MVSTNTDFDGRQTFYAMSQDMLDNTFAYPKFGLLGRTQPMGRSREARRSDLPPPRCVGYPSNLQTPNFPLEVLCASLSGRHGEGGWRLTRLPEHRYRRKTT